MEARAPQLDPEHTLAVRLLGRLEVTVGTHEVRLPGRHAQALLALLVLEPRIRAREAIAADLWPDANSSSAGSLRQALWLVRSGLADARLDPDSFLEQDGESIGLQPGARVDLDSTRFEQLVRGVPARPELALSLYRGELAEGLAHECFARDRERLADAYEDALALAAEDRLRAGDFGGARVAAERLLARDPLREEAHAILIRLYGATGSRSQVLRQFRRLAIVLNREIGVEPLPETVAAYRAALAETVERSRKRTANAALRRLSSVPALAAIG
jgi:DNA-binding SARP family transcriptional activator